MEVFTLMSTQGLRLLHCWYPLTPNHFASISAGIHSLLITFFPPTGSQRQHAKIVSISGQTSESRATRFFCPTLVLLSHERERDVQQYNAKKSER